MSDPREFKLGNEQAPVGDGGTEEDVSSLRCPVLQGVKGFYDHPGV
jgi:hypothetical protein